ncbi:MAG: hypothetical protein ABJA67_07170 [Chthonomonadales bacterium]
MKIFLALTCVLLTFGLYGCPSSNDCLAVVTATSRSPTITGTVTSINAASKQFNLATGPPTVCQAQTLIIGQTATTTYEHVNHAAATFSDIVVGNSVTITGDFNAISVFVSTHTVIP